MKIQFEVTTQELELLRNLVRSRQYYTTVIKNQSMDTRLDHLDKSMSKALSQDETYIDQRPYQDWSSSTEIPSDTDSRRKR